MSSTEKIIKHPHGDLLGFEWNPTSQRKVLMMHGWQDNCESFHKMGPELSQSWDAHVVAFDFPGHGLSFHKPGLYGYYYHDWIVDVELVLQELGWNEVELVCHSMGASVAAVFASIFPERVKQLVLFDAYLPLSAEPQSIISRYRSYVSETITAISKPSRVMKSQEDAVRIRQMATPDLPPDTCERIAMRNTRQNEDGQFEWTIDQKLKLPSPLRLTKEHIVTIHESLTLPTTFFLGKNSPYKEFHPIVARWVSGRDNFRVFEVEAGHWPHAECVKEILDAF